MKKWTAKTGKWEKSIIFFAGFFGVTIIDFFFIENSIAAIFYAFILFLGGLFLIQFLFFGKKMVVGIEIEESRRVVIIEFVKDQKEELLFDDMAFSFHGNLDQFDYCSLSFYHTFLGSRNQLVTKKIKELIGLNWSFSWKKKQLLEVREDLIRLGIQEVASESEEDPLWSKIISS